MDTSTLPVPVQTVIERLFQTFDINLPGGFVFAPNLLQAILMVVLIFLLIYTLGHLRHTYVGWSVKGILPGLSFGFALALILEGLFLIGGKTVFTELIGWKDAPKPISTVLEGGREKLVDVLGVAEEIPISSAKEAPTMQSVVKDMSTLSPADQEAARKVLCQPN